MADDQPCRCLNNHTFIAPLHEGHCCFHPANQTCHPDEVAAWVQANRRIYSEGRR